jgi:hypothetical protein
LGKGKKTGGRDFKKGQSGNPSGGVKLPAEIRDIRKLSVEEYKRVVESLLNSSELTLQTTDLDPTAPYLERIVAKCLKRIYESGSIYSLDILLNRLIGRVPDVTPKSGDEESRNGFAVLEEIRKVINDPRNERKA